MTTVDEVAESACFASCAAWLIFAQAECARCLPALRAKLESTGALRRLRARLRADVTLALETEQARPCCAFCTLGVRSPPRALTPRHAGPAV
jgi:hypothetical protein